MDKEYEEDTSDHLPLVGIEKLESQKSLPWRTLKAFLIVLPLVTIGALSNTPHSTIDNQLVYQLFGGKTEESGGQDNSTTKNQSTCVASINKTSEDDIQKQSTNFKLYMQIGSSLAACIFVPVWGALSDNLGRHVIVFGSAVGSIIRVTSMLILSVKSSAPKWILILGDTLHSCFGKSSSGLIMACAAIVADELPQGKRTFMMIFVDFLLMVSETAGQLGTGYWIKKSGFTPILIACLAGQFLMLLYSVIIMPRISKRSSNEAYKDVPFCSKIQLYFVTPYKAYFKSRQGFTRTCLLLLVLIVLLRYIGEYGIHFLLTIYALGPPLCWDSVILGIFNSVKVGLSGAVPMLIGLFMIKREPSSWLILLGLLGGVGSSIVYGFAVVDAMMFIAAAILSPGILVSAVSRSFLADLTLETEHGAVMSGYVLVGQIGELLSQSSFNKIYDATIATCSQCFFFFSAGFYGLAVIALGCFALAMKKNYNTKKRVNELENPVIQ